MSKKEVAVLGGTGLIGRELVNLLLAHPEYEKVHLLGRRESGIDHPKVKEHVMPLSEMANYEAFPAISEAFCCIGTTMKQAGSKEAFYQVDHEYVKIFAEKSLANGATLFSMVSSMGAKVESSFFYNQVKGKIEELVRGMGFERTQIFRPSLLLGDRKEKRLGEKLSAIAMQTFDKVIPQKYKAIEGHTVAQAMVNLANQPSYQGDVIIESDAIRKMG